MSHTDSTTGNSRPIAPPPPPVSGPPPALNPVGVHIGISSERLVDTFDRDGDGAISLDNGEHSLVSVSGGMVRHTSVERLARSADAMGNNDGKATAAEVAGVKDHFDTGHGPSGIGKDDGFLIGREFQNFKDVLGPETRTSLIAPPLPPPPGIVHPHPHPMPPPPVAVHPSPMPPVTPHPMPVPGPPPGMVHPHPMPPPPVAVHPTPMPFPPPPAAPHGPAPMPMPIEDVQRMLAAAKTAQVAYGLDSDQVNGRRIPGNEI